MKYFLYLFFITSLSTAQKIKLLDKTSKNPISFATIIIYQGNKEIEWNYCNEQGEYLIESKNYTFLKISCIGYEELKVNEKTIPSIIYMNPKENKLKEIIISKIKKDTILGEINLNKFKTNSLNIENQEAVFFENPFKKQIDVKSFLFRVEKVKTKVALRIHFYSKKDYIQKYFIPKDVFHIENQYVSFIPENDIFESNLIQYLEKGTAGLVEIEFKKFDIELPIEGFFVAIEGVAYYDEKNEIIVNPKEKLKIEFHKTEYDNYCFLELGIINKFWKNVNKYTRIDIEKVFKKNVSKSEMLAPSFGIKVYKE